MSFYSKTITAYPPPLQRAGPFMLLSPGSSYPECLHPDVIPHVSPHMPAAQDSCDYCKSLYAHGAIRCESCGAPRKERKPTYRDEWPAARYIPSHCTGS
jgi:hypothetical protein